MEITALLNDYRLDAAKPAGGVHNARSRVQYTDSDKGGSKGEDT